MAPTDSSFQYGLTLLNGSQIIHGAGANTRPAYPPETKISGTLQVFSPGHTASPSTTPCFCGPAGIFLFDTSTRMPRHVHMTPSDHPEGKQQRYVTEKIFVPDGVALVELGGQLYVIPPKTMVLIAPGVPHTWTACPAGLNVTQAFGLSTTEVGEDGEVISNGKFMAVYEYEDATGFYPTKQTERLQEVGDYVRCDDLHSIRIPEYTVEQVLKEAFIVWERETRRAGQKN